jgi:phosphomannomutase
MAAQVSLDAVLTRSHCRSTVLLFAVVNKFDYGFAENGLTAYKLGKQLPSQSFIKHVGEEKYKPLVNFILRYIADLDIPIKR